jgi:hypothetical protein
MNFRIRNFADISHREYQNTHFVFSKLFPENYAVYETMWKHIVQPDRPQIAI